MGSSLEFFSATAADASLPLLSGLLFDLQEQNAFGTQNKSDLQLISTNISNFLSRGSTRAKGLLILKSLLSSGICQNEFISEYGPKWLPLCINTLKPNAVSPNEKTLAYYVIRQLLEKSSKVHELDKSIAGTSLVDLIEILHKSPPALYIPALQCLETVLSKYSKASGAHKAPLERFLIQFLDSQDKNAVVCAAKCAHLLQQVRGGGEQGVNHKLAWKNQFALYIKSASEIVKKILSISNVEASYANISYFSNSSVENGNTISKNMDNTPFYLALKHICDDASLYDIVKKKSEYEDDDEIDESVSNVSSSNLVVMKIARLYIRLKNLLVFVQSMMVDPYPVAKSIKCTALLELLLQCLSLKYKISNQDNISFEILAITAFVPNLHIAVLKTIEALTISIQKNVVPYGLLLLKMILQVLENTKSEEYNGGLRPYKNIRKAAYKTLCCLFSMVSTLKPPPQEGEQGFEDKLIANILSDVSYYKPTFQLTVKNTGSLKHLSKKARNKLNMSQLEASNIVQNNNSSNEDYEESIKLNSDLTESALSCLEAFFKAAGVFLKQNTHQMVQDVLVKEAYNKSTVKIRRDVLLKSLCTVNNFQSSQQPSIVSYCIDTLSRNQHTSSNYRDFCNTNLVGCIGSIRGSVAPLNIPLIRTEEHEHRAVFSETENDKHCFKEKTDIIDLDNYVEVSEKNTSKKRKHENINKRISNKSSKNTRTTNGSESIDILNISDSDDSQDIPCIVEPVQISQNVNISSKDNVIYVDEMSSDNNVKKLSSNASNDLTENLLNSEVNILDIANELMNSSLQQRIEVNISDNVNDLTDDMFAGEIVETINDCQKNTIANVESHNRVEDTDIQVDEVPRDETVENLIEKPSEEVLLKDQNDGKLTVQDMMRCFVDEVIDEFKE